MLHSHRFSPFKFSSHCSADVSLGEGWREVQTEVQTEVLTEVLMEVLMDGVRQQEKLLKYANELMSSQQLNIFVVFFLQKFLHPSPSIN